MEDWKEELLTALLECGYRDLERLEEFLRIAKELNINIDLDGIIWELKDEEINIDLNMIMFKVMETIVYDLAEELNKVEEAQEKFNPFLNYLDSWFNNDLDELIGREEITREEALKLMEKWLNN